MNFEFKTLIDDCLVNVFMQNSFFNSVSLTTLLHKHVYPEVHIIANGQIEYTINGKSKIYKKYDMVLIPRETLHSSKVLTDDTRVIPFHLGIKDYKFTLPFTTIEPYWLDTLISEIETFKSTYKCEKLKGILVYLLAPFFEDKKKKVNAVKDREYLIEDFIEKNYPNEMVTVQDLADELNLSVKQTEREVSKYLGMTFRDAISKERIEVAKLLEEQKLYSQKEISEMVGYSSYSGYFKAKKKFN